MPTQNYEVIPAVVVWDALIHKRGLSDHLGVLPTPLSSSISRKCVMRSSRGGVIWCPDAFAFCSSTSASAWSAAWESSVL